MKVTDAACAILALYFVGLALWRAVEALFGVAWQPLEIAYAIR